MSIIRPCRKNDISAVRKLVSGIWDGNDYLPLYFSDWVDDGNFYAIEHNGRIAGTGKITLLPGKTAWLEGLRIDPALQGHGLGKELAGFIFSRALDLQKRGKVRFIEFSTYYLNDRSIGISAKAGFRTMESFYILAKEKDKGSIHPVKSDISGADLKYSNYIPAGWKFLHRTHGYLKWLNNNCSAYTYDGLKVYIRKNDTVINPAGIPDPDKITAVGNSIMSGDYFETILTENEGHLVKDFLKRGWFFWDKPHKPNMSVYRYSPGVDIGS